MRFCRIKTCVYVAFCFLLMGFILVATTFYQNAAETLYPEAGNQGDFKMKPEPLNGLGSNQTGLIWFAQVTDIHLSIFRDPKRVPEFGQLCHWLRKVVKPPVVVATGDLTDAKTPDLVGSRQFVQEWTFYRTTVQTCLAGSEMQWLDIRGNHDTFDVIGESAENNFFKTYSIMGSKHQRSYSAKVEFANRTFGFVGIDATLVPGPKRPFNFFGALHDQQFDEAKHLIEDIKRETDSHVVFGHYPTSCIVAPSPGVRHLLHDAKAYLCGHLHTLAGIVPEMFARQKEGFFELELGDWKDNRLFRILAIDNGQLSFTDATFRGSLEADDDVDDTVIVVTNPTDVRFSTAPNSIEAVRASTNIRVLVFSSRDVVRVSALIDDVDAFECRQVTQGHPLYVADWNPAKYDDASIHSLRINVESKSGHGDSAITGSKMIQFGLGSKDNFSGVISNDFSFMARVVLLTNLLTFTQACFGLGMAGIVIPLCLLRAKHHLTVTGHLTRPRRPSENSWLVGRILRRIERRFWLMSALDSMFYPIVLAPIYLLVGPWAVGYFIEDTFGVLFCWGLYLNGTLLHGDTTSFFAVVFIVPYIYFFVFILSGIVEQRFDRDGRVPANETFFRYLVTNIWFFVLMMLQVVHFLDSFYCYGIVASLGVLGLGRFVFFYLLWSKAHSISADEYVAIQKVLSKNS